MLRVHRPDSAGPSAPEIAEWIVVRLADELQIPADKIDVELPWIQFGLDSMRVLSLTCDLVDWLGRDLAADLLWKYPTIARLSTHLAGDGEQGASSLGLVPMRAGGNKPPLVLFPALAHRTTSLANLVAHLDDDQPVYSVEPLGWEEGQEIPDRIEDMAAAYVAWIDKELPDGPCSLAGRCVGGLVALEAAQQLRERGRCVPLLAILDTHAPGIAEGTTPWNRAWLNALARLETARVGRPSWVDRIRRSPLPEAEPRKWLTPRHREVYEAGRLARSRHVPQPYNGRCELLRAEAKSWIQRTLQVGLWRAIAGANLRIHAIPGGHRTIGRNGNEVSLARRLQASLNEATRQLPLAAAAPLRRAA
jgi:thioesterase domain-containing protein/acyl carrier protein